MYEKENPYAARRVGNVLLYTGVVPGCRDTLAEIVIIEQLNDGEEAYVLKMMNWKKEQQEIFAYQKDVADTKLTAALLEKIGFRKEEKRKVYSFKGVNVLDATTIKANEDRSLEYSWRGWVVVIKDVALPLQDDEVVKNSLPVPSLNILQNYLADEFKIIVDTGMFTAP